MKNFKIFLLLFFLLSFFIISSQLIDTRSSAKSTIQSSYVNAGVTSGPLLNQSNTINPTWFWPAIYGPAPQKHETQVKLEENHDHEHYHYDDPEYTFDYILIEYVGEYKFDEWFYSLNEEERTMTNFKKEFNLTKSDIDRIMTDYKKN